MYEKEDKTYVQQESCEYTHSFDMFGAEFEFNEIRFVWNCGGWPIVCRLQDRTPAWDNSTGVYELGLPSLVPNMLTQGQSGCTL